MKLTISVTNQMLLDMVRESLPDMGRTELFALLALVEAAARESNRLAGYTS